MEPGDEVSLMEHLLRHRRLVFQLYRILEDASLVVQDNGRSFRRSGTPVPTPSVSLLYTRMLDEHPQYASETKVLHATGKRLADCLSGKADPLALLFRDSATRAFLEDVYKNAPMFKAISMLLSQYLTSVVKRFGDSREIRVLEIGAGTGGTTQHLAQALSELEHKFSYTFSDISPSLVANARRKFAKWTFMSYSVIDIEGSINPEFISRYDIILSTNCIHATKDLVYTTTNIHKMLRSDGILCLVEATRNLYWFDLVFGLLDGWWLSTDGRDHPLVDEQHWARDLRAAGFKWIDWSTGASEESHFIKVITASPFDATPTVDTSMALCDNLKGVNNTSLQQTMIFKTADGLDLFADIYFPLNRDLSLMIHGGGHVMLSRKDVRPEQTALLLEKGFLPISVDYRLCPEITLRDGPMADVRDALAWIRTSLPKLQLLRSDVQVDGDKVVAVGWSTGGHLAMSLAWTSPLIGIPAPNAILAFYCPNDYEDTFWMKPNIPAGSRTMDTADSQASYELDDSIWRAVNSQAITAYNVSTTKRALGGWMAPSDPRSRLVLHMNWHGRTLHVLLNGMNKKTRKRPPTPSKADIISVSPLAQARLGKYATPTFIIHPREDDLIPWQQAERMWETLQARGTDSELRILDDVPHLFDLYHQHRENESVKQAMKEGYEFLCGYVGLC
ncbi:Non-reducing polyketide synthase ausA [Cladobotryum mycophilum]|uniref:Non-reducing polyketide synthase ausA n=1 Tax=Cladobotryum mycophilum TaxID=491253 RepID=A0ABR0STA7_9HYPO